MSYRKDCFEFWKIEHKGGFWLPCKCQDCKGALFNAAIIPWEAAHLVARAHGGSDDPTNVVPMQKDCHRHLTSTVDVPRIAKGRRTAEKHYGVREKRGRPMPGSKASGLKKKMDGTVEVRMDAASHATGGRRMSILEGLRDALRHARCEHDWRYVERHSDTSAWTRRKCTKCGGSETRVLTPTGKRWPAYRVGRPKRVPRLESSDD